MALYVTLSVAMAGGPSVLAVQPAMAAAATTWPSVAFTAAEAAEAVAAAVQQ